MGSRITGILLFKSDNNNTLEEAKLTSTTLPTKYFLSNATEPKLIPCLLPLLIITDLKKGLFLSLRTFANVL